MFQGIAVYAGVLGGGGFWKDLVMTGVQFIEKEAWLIKAVTIGHSVLVGV